jgi:hypothetical protein
MVETHLSAHSLLSVVAAVEALTTLLVVMVVQQVAVLQTVTEQLKVRSQQHLPRRATMAVQRIPADSAAVAVAAQVVRARTVAAISAATVALVAQSLFLEHR